MTEIENQWAICFGLGGLFYIGKIVEDNKSCLTIFRYDTERAHPLQIERETLWNPSFVKRYEKIEEAVIEYLKEEPRMDKIDFIRNMIEKFPLQKTNLEKLLAAPREQ